MDNTANKLYSIYRRFLFAINAIVLQGFSKKGRKQYLQKYRLNKKN